MKDFIIFFAGSLLLAPIIICGLSGDVLGFVIAVVYAHAIVYSVKFFPKFWSRWWRINMYFVSIFEGRKYDE